MENNKSHKYIIIVSFIAVIAMILLIIYGENIHYDRYVDSVTNSPTKLNIVSAYGDNEAYHPKVLYFKDGWNGYKYWMSFTPYPHADSAYENPHVKVSNDMITWIDPVANINPLDEVKNPDNNTRYNSDSHLVYNSDLDQLECWWRYVDDEKKDVTIYRRVSKDGKKWAEKEIVYREKRANNDWISPAIIYEDKTYKIWYVFDEEIYYTESKDLKDFSQARKLDVTFEDPVSAWHLDVIHTDKGYEMIVVAFTDWNHRAFMNLYYTISSDNNHYQKAKVIIDPATDTDNWDNSGLYRSSLLSIDGTYYVYYSGQSTDNAKGIGLMYGRDIFHLEAYPY